MMLFDARTDVHKHAQGFVTALSKTIWLLIGALVPAVVTAFVKAMQDRSRSQRSQQLTDRISTLSKSIADLPEVSVKTGDAPITPRQALTAELNLVVAELYVLQSQVKHSFHWVSMNLTSRIRSALLLFRPRGFKAVMLHSAFYVYTAVFLFCAIAVIVPSSPASSDASAAQDTTAAQDASLSQNASASQNEAAPQDSAAASQDNPPPSQGEPHRHRRAPAPSPENQPFLSTQSWSDFFSDLAAYVFMVGIASVPMLLLRFYALKIHRQQIQAASSQAPLAPSSPAPVTSHAAASS